MATLLIIDASGRVTRSITRGLTERFRRAWLGANPGGKVVIRDVGTVHPSAVHETWIAAAFEDEAARTEEQRAILAESERLINELAEADMVVLGVPMYNFGMPAQLKAYFDQVIRVGRTFAYDTSLENPYRPMMRRVQVVAILSAGDGELFPGGSQEHLNFLDAHLETMLTFIGLGPVEFVRVGYSEFRDERYAASLKAAEAEVDRRAAGKR
jgi:FMN-dependent NADH-azoreductase